MAEHELVLDLDEIGGDMLPVVGGKAANLGQLSRAGLPVPSGFCLTTEAYRRMARSASSAVLDGGRGSELDVVLDALGSDPGVQRSPAGLAVLAGRARAAVLAEPIPEEVRAAAIVAYARLGPDVAVAVRSSATAEDLPYASFAGQQDTYLNVVGTDAVLDAVRRCWASLWTDRAVSYRATNGIDHGAVLLAVVVQRMVDATVAGVMFTANPVTGRRGEAVIDASPGLGEAVVSGAVNPDRFVVDAGTGAVVERRLGDKRLVIRSVAGGGTEHVERAGGADRACLTDAQLRELAALGRRVEVLYGAPQDTEWAVDDAGALWLTQARPITTLYPLPVDPVPPGAGTRAYFCASLAQGLVRPVTPMGIATFRAIGSGMAAALGAPVADPLAGPPALVDAGHRLFLDVTGVLANPIGRRLLPRVLDMMEARSAVILRELAADPRFPATGSAWRLARRAGRFLLRYRVPPRVVHGVLRPAEARRRVDEFGAALRRRLEPPGTFTSEQRLDHVERILSTGYATILGTVGPLALGSAFGMLGMASALLGADAGPGELATVLRGLPHNVTTEMDLRLWSLAGRLRADATAATALREQPAAELARRYLAGELSAVVQDGVAGFLREYGHRAVAEIDVGMPRWSDDPAHIFGVLANYLRLDDPRLAPDAVFTRGAQEAEETVRRLVAVARLRGRLRGALVGFGLRRARELAGLRELPKFYWVLVFEAVRRELAVVGAELAEAGTLRHADDVWFLTLREVRRAAHGETGLDPRVSDRRESYERELRRPQIPRVLLSDGTEPEAVARSGAGPTVAGAAGAGLVGTAASAGTVTGVARVVLDPVGAHLEPGEILVAPSTDPGWTPLFLTAGALVMEMGGSNSHGAVVAREYGIPAVVGVPDATRRIVTGQRITVHGAAGRVTPG